VETISAIYEEFMKDADLTKRRNEGAYYTPRHLAETTLHVALENRYTEAKNWRVLDPACGSGIFLVAMFNLLAEQWRLENSTRRKQTKAQALLEILLRQIRGVDVNPDACRIATFSVYLALFEKLQPIDVDAFKEKVRHKHFLPPLLWDNDLTKQEQKMAVVLHGNFLADKLLPLANDFDLVIGNPPWESRGDKQIALHFAKRSLDFLGYGGIGCLLLPSTILVNRYGTLDGEWFRAVTVEKLVQLADFRFVLFKATHPCFIIRYVKAKPTMPASATGPRWMPSTPTCALLVMPAKAMPLRRARWIASSTAHCTET
jgi:SAM-dependent methyltransferase